MRRNRTLLPLYIAAPLAALGIVGCIFYFCGPGHFPIRAPEEAQTESPTAERTAAPNTADEIPVEAEPSETDGAEPEDAVWQPADLQTFDAPGDLPLASYTASGEIDVLYYHMDESQTAYYNVCRLTPDGNQSTVSLQGIPSDVTAASFAAGGGYCWLLAGPADESDAAQSVFCLSADGTMVRQTELSAPVSGSLHATADGSVWLEDHTSAQVFRYGTDGTLMQTVNMPEGGIDTLAEGNGSGLYGLYARRDGSGMDLYPLSENGFGDKISWDGTVPDAVLPGLRGLFLYAAGDSLFEYYPESGSSKKLFSFSECGIDAQQIFGILKGSGGQLLVLWQGSALNQYRLSTLQQSVNGYLNDLITLAALDCSDALNELVTLYNRSGRPYVIQVVEYADSTGAGTEASDAQTRLNADLIAGTDIDLVDFSGVKDKNLRRQYVQLGLLENLYPWMKRDPDFEETDYQTQVWKANEIDGGLYNLVPFYRVDTVFGKESLYGQRQQITPEEVYSSPDPLKIYGRDYTCYDVLRAYCTYVLDGSADSVRSQVQNTDRLRLLFQFASAYPQTDTGGGESIIDIHNGNQWMQAAGTDASPGIGRDMEAYLSCLALMGENISFTGYPTDTGIGSSFEDTISLGMCASSDNQEGVWDFFRFLLGEDTQNNTEDLVHVSSMLPVKRTAWENACRTAMSLEAGNGVGIFREDQEWYVTFPVISQAQVNSIGQLLGQITRVSEYDASLYAIFAEELDNVRNGTTSLEESVGRLQSRASNYLDETE